ncbi:MAG: ChaN family lipoprotein [bacterium]
MNTADGRTAAGRVRYAIRMLSRPVLLAFLLPVSAAMALALSIATGISGAQPLQPAETDRCPQPGSWLATTTSPGSSRDTALQPRPGPELIAEAARRQVVLLGEHHDNADHHRWQLQVLAALHARRPDMAIGFEMFPRRVQPALDRWVAGELSEAEFLRLSDWNRVWGFDPRLYLPLFHFARLNRIPMIALNVERTLVRQVGASGWDSVPEAQREGITRATPAPEAYAAQLRKTFEMHLPPRAPGAAAPADSDIRFTRFLEAQLTWDRAMAEALAHRARASPAPLVVGVMGSGHLQFGHGVPHQLRALGIADPYTMLPFDAAPGPECARPPQALANAVFIVPAGAAPVPGQRLGIALSGGEGSPRIEKVAPDSLAARSGLRAGDRIERVAGATVRAADDVTAAVRDQPPGTILPVVVQRDGREIEVMVRFPPRAP